MTGISTLGQALDQIERIKQQQGLYDDLSTQITTGRKTQRFSGLKNDVVLSQRARADFKSLESYINNATIANRRIDLMSKAIEEFKAQAKNFQNVLATFSQEGVHQKGDKVTYDDPLTPNVVEATQVGMTDSAPDADLFTLQRLAKNIYGLMVDLVNTKDGERFLFGGADTLTQPLTDNGTLESAISAQITAWKNGTISTDDLVANLAERNATTNPDAITDTIVGYSPALSAGNAGRIFIRVQQNAEIEYTALANDPAFRDVFVALSYFKSDELGPIADTYVPPNSYPGVPDKQGAPGTTLEEMKTNFYAVFNKLTASVNAAIDRADEVGGSIETARARISELKESQKEQKNVLLSTVADVENSDINELAVKIQSLQIQINASLAVTARIQDLSLVNFLFR
jgi:flagellar hook-associated protein 3 FlgL